MRYYGILASVLVLFSLTIFHGARGALSVKQRRYANPEIAKDYGGVSYEEALSNFTIASYLLEAGSARSALRFLEAAWEQSEGSQAVGVKLAEVYFQLGYIGRCKAITDEILAGNKDNFSAALLRAKVQYLEGEKAEAAKTLERLSEMQPNDLEVLRLLGRVYQETGRYEQAIEVYAKAVLLNPSSAYMQYRYGLLLEEPEHLDEAIAAFKKALSINPEFNAAAFELAAIYEGKGMYNAAESLLVGVVSRDPDDDKATAYLGDLYLKLGKYDAGIKLFEERKRQGELERSGELILGRLYYRAKEYDEAFKVFQSLFAGGGGKSAELARILGEISLRLQKPSKALDYYKLAIKLNPKDYKNYLNLFLASSPEFSPKEVRIDLPADELNSLLHKAGSLINVDDFEGLYLLGISYQTVDSLESARKMLLRAYELKPKDEGILLALANLEQKSKNLEEAEKYLKVLYAIDPDDPTVNNFYGYLLAEKGVELEKAEKMVKKALSKDPNNGYYIDSLGWIYFKRGDYDRAVFELERANEFVSNDPIILEHLGDAYRALKRFEKALAAYERSKELQGKNEQILEKIKATRKGID